KELIKWYDLSFSEAYEFLKVVDKNDVIQLLNKEYSRYIEISEDEVVGKLASDVIEDTRLPDVLKTGIPKRSCAHKLRRQNLIVNRLTIWKDNEVIGAIGMLVYEGVSEIYQSIERMEMLEDTFNQKSKMLSKNLYSSKQQMRFE